MSSYMGQTGMIQVEISSEETLARTIGARTGTHDDVVGMAWSIIALARLISIPDYRTLRIAAQEFIRRQTSPGMRGEATYVSGLALKWIQKYPTYARQVPVNVTKRVADELSLGGF